MDFSGLWPWNGLGHGWMRGSSTPRVQWTQVRADDEEASVVGSNAQRELAMPELKEEWKT